MLEKLLVLTCCGARCSAGHWGTLVNKINSIYLYGPYILVGKIDPPKLIL